MWKCLLVVGDSWLPFKRDDFTEKWVKEVFLKMGLKGQFTQKIHTFSLTCGAIYQSR